MTTPTSARRTDVEADDELVELAHETARTVPGLLGRRGRLRSEHDVAELPAHARARPRALGRRRDSRDKARPRRQRAPWLQLERDLGVVVRFVGVHEDLSLDLDDLARQLGDRTRVVAFPVAANSVGTTPDIGRIVELAHDAGALAWADAVHYGPHGPIDVAAWGWTCSSARRTSSSGLTWGWRSGAGAARVVAAVQGASGADEPVGRRFELGTSQHELLAGFVAAVEYVESLGWDAIVAHERALGERFLAGLPDGVELYGLQTMEGRVPTFCFNVPGHTSEVVATHLADAQEVAVWWGNYYSLETMKGLGLDDWMGAVRAGIVHYNTDEEVDRLLAGIAELV